MSRIFLNKTSCQEKFIKSQLRTCTPTAQRLYKFYRWFTEHSEEGYCSACNRYKGYKLSRSRLMIQLSNKQLKQKGLIINISLNKNKPIWIANLKPISTYKYLAPNLAPYTYIDMTEPNKLENKEKKENTLIDSHNNDSVPAHPSAPKGERSTNVELFKPSFFNCHGNDNFTDIIDKNTAQTIFNQTLWDNPNAACTCGSKKEAFKKWCKITNNGTQNVSEVQKGREAYVAHQKALGQFIKRLDFFLNPRKELWKAEWPNIQVKKRPYSFEKNPYNWAPELFKRKYINENCYQKHEKQEQWQYATNEFKDACQKAIDDGLFWIVLKDEYGFVHGNRLISKEEADKRIDDAEKFILSYKPRWEKDVPQNVLNVLETEGLRKHIKDASKLYFLLKNLCDEYKRNDQYEAYQKRVEEQKVYLPQKRVEEQKQEEQAKHEAVKKWVQNDETRKKLFDVIAEKIYIKQELSYQELTKSEADHFRKHDVKPIASFLQNDVLTIAFEQCKIFTQVVEKKYNFIAQSLSNPIVKLRFLGFDDFYKEFQTCINL